MDSNEIQAIGSDFATELLQLTFNSKPIITNLTIIAQENKVAAFAIAEAIENHITKAVPTQKLPAMYLMDSIVKNIGEPYTCCFAKKLNVLFIRVYSVVDAITRKKLEDLFQTWKVSLVGGKFGGSVFPLEVLHSIDTQLTRFKNAAIEIQKRHKLDQMMQPNMYKQQRPVMDYAALCYNGTTLYTQSPILEPAAPTPAHWPQLLNQQAPQQPVDCGFISIEQSLLGDIGTQIARFEKHLGYYANDVNAQEQLTALQDLKHILLGSKLPMEQLAEFKHQIALISQTPLHEMQNPVISGYPFAHSMMQDYSQRRFHPYARPLVSQANFIGQRTATLPQAALEKPLVADTLAISEMLEAPDFKTKNLTSKRPHLIGILCNKLPLQCKTCGRRFPNDSKGIKKRDNHLDWHFNVNKRIRDSVTYEKARSWFLTEEVWITLSTEDTFENDESDAAETAIIKKKSDRFYVVAALEPSKAHIPCSICQEKFISEWSDQVDDWVWYDTVKVNDKVYHINCYNDTRKPRIKDEEKPQVDKMPAQAKHFEQPINDQQTAEASIDISNIDLGAILSNIKKNFPLDKQSCTANSNV